MKRNTVWLAVIGLLMVVSIWLVACSMERRSGQGPASVQIPQDTAVPSNLTVEPSVTAVPITESVTPVPTTLTDQFNAQQARNQALHLAEAGVSSNDEWQPLIQEFNGVQMALVPVGCFTMGSQNEDGSERPMREVCFDEPYWIDVYEVTNEQYGSTVGRCTKYASGGDQPHACVNWFDSITHCESRWAQLPTEVEWEYASRGPDNLGYPWGNEFVADNVVYGENSNGPIPVGSKPGGISWVGAYDLSGNLWEWVNSIYVDYPYDPDDGREADRNADDSSQRVLRGGSWYTFNTLYLRGSARIASDPGSSGMQTGFRCVRPYSQ